MNRNPVAEAVERLQAERARTQSLNWDTVLSICRRRQLDVSQVAAVRAQLHALGLLLDGAEITKSSGPRVPRGTSSSPPMTSPCDSRSRPAPLFPKNLERHHTLQRHEELLLARRIRAMVELRAHLDGREPTLDEKAILGEGEKAYEKFVLANIRLVTWQARRVRRRYSTLDFSDLVQEGMFGLLRAAERFDPEPGHRFATYGSWLIMSSIEGAFVDRGHAVRWSRSAVRSHRRVQAVRAKIAAESGAEPHLSDLSDASGVSPARIVAMGDWARVTSSLDDARLSAKGQSSGRGLASPVKTPEELVVEADEVERLHRVIRALDQRTAMIVRLRFGFVDGTPWTQKQIADELKLTESRICQIEAKTLPRLAKAMEPREIIHCRSLRRVR